ncbi:MAG TPA: glycosyltransferase family 4 protein [Myxococcales bacterium]|jgi:glycosyltransferase involved in cell wall biosynthesis|nr:glycosyltransferase family 4 protein [Myxococcales bacterium]
MAVRIAHLIYGLALGGLEQLVLQLASRSRERGIESSIVALAGPDGPVGDLARKQSIDFELLPSDGMSLSALMGIRRALEKQGASVLHAHDLGPWLNAVAVRAVRPRTRVMATFHEQGTPEGKKRKAAALAARATDALVACGDKVRQDILGWAPSGARVPVIANGVPLDAASFAPRDIARREMGIPDGVVAVGYAGGLREIKGPDKLLEAFLDKFADRGDVHLYLIGAGPMEPSLRAAARGHANVHFTGLIPGASRLLTALDVYAQTSLSEGRSLSMLEAMAAGLPTVAHDLLPVREIHAHEETALLAPLGDRPALGAALQRLTSDAALRQRLGHNARERAARHSIEPMVDAYASLYRELSARS